ncbi:MAG: hypothetical protein ACTSUR_04530 [Candidatus Heimdallarchaeaceae archaeon]
MAKQKLIKCKGCGNTWLPTEVPTNKEWTKVAPMPDKDGNITIIVMATWSCPKCEKTVMGAKGKTKGEVKEEDTKKYKIETALKSGKKVDLELLAKDMKVKVESLEKIIPMYVKKLGLKGKIKGKYFIPE